MKENQTTLLYKRGRSLTKKVTKCDIGGGGLKQSVVSQHSSRLIIQVNCKVKMDIEGRSYQIF